MTSGNRRSSWQQQHYDRDHGYRVQRHLLVIMIIHSRCIYPWRRPLPPPPVHDDRTLPSRSTDKANAAVLAAVAYELYRFVPRARTPTAIKHPPSPCIPPVHGSRFALPGDPRSVRRPVVSASRHHQHGGGTLISVSVGLLFPPRVDRPSLSCLVADPPSQHEHHAHGISGQCRTARGNIIVNNVSHVSLTLAVDGVCVCTRSFFRFPVFSSS